MNRRIGIFGGSFNPVHIGHLALADHIARTTDLSQVWLCLSPQNPLKHSSDIVPDDLRLQMLQIALQDNPLLQCCDIELDMPRPSYTIDTLRRLSVLHPDCKFSLIIGADNWAIFDQWRDYQEIIRSFSPIIYPRPGYDIDPSTLPPTVTLVDAPQLEISSTFIRDCIKNGIEPRYFVTDGVLQFIHQHQLYI